MDTNVTNCLNCQKEFKPKRINSKYCSAKCSNYHRVKTWVEKNKKACPSCGISIRSTSNKCNSCVMEDRHKKDLTVADYTKLRKHSHPSWLYSDIRNFARTWNKSLKKQCCKSCGYSKHVEIAHIKPICEFSQDTKLSIVNSPDNLIPLCPNCHWEFDNGLLKIT